MVKIYRSGVPSDQGATRKGRAFFILNNLGDYTVIADAPGYETTRKEVSGPVALKAEVDVYLKRVSAANESTGVPGKPMLAESERSLRQGLAGVKRPHFLDSISKVCAV